MSKGESPRQALEIYIHQDTILVLLMVAFQGMFHLYHWDSI
jgi:hypothetical protein